MNLDLLVASLESVEKKNQELRILRDFVRLVFPQEGAELLSPKNGEVSANLEGELLSRWRRMEDLKNRSIQEAAIMAQQNVGWETYGLKNRSIQEAAIMARNRM